MIIKNKTTLKEYRISKEKYNNFPQRVKDIFIVVDDSELKDPEQQQIKNVVIEKKEQGKKEVDKTTKKPATGNKQDKKSQKT